MRRLAVIGASGHGRVVADIAESCGWDSIHFFDDARESDSSMNGCWSVVGKVEDFFLSATSYDGVVVAIGNNEIRGKMCEDIIAKNINLVSLIHSAAVVSRYAQICSGSVIMAGAVINAYAVIGRGAIVNTIASVDHDCYLDAYVHISPGAHLAGGVTIGSKTWVGIGACVKQQVTIGAQVTVGAGAVVVKNIPDNLTVVGVPACPF